MSSLLFLRQCSICRKRTQPNLSAAQTSQNEEIFTRFSILVSRYLNLVSKSADPKCTLETAKLTLGMDKHLCGSCAPVAESFCRMYDVWFCLQLEMNRCLDEFSNGISSTAVKQERVKLFKQEFQPTTSPQHESCDKPASDDQLDFPEALLKKFEQFKSQSFPRLKLKRVIDIPTQWPPLPSLSKRSKNAESHGDYGEDPLQVKMEVEDDQSFQMKCFNHEEHFDQQDEHVLTNDKSDEVHNKASKPVILNGRKIFDSVNKLGGLEAPVEKTKNQKQVKLQQYPCTECGRQFVHKRNLVTHIKIKHLEGKPFSCAFCRLDFEKRSNHDRHMRGHTKENPYVCQICLEEFPFPHHLGDHKKIAHLGESIKCRYCSRRFVRMSTCRNHERLVHKKDYEACNNKGLARREVCYNCMFCKMTFNSRIVFRLHMHRHTDKMRYDCTLCPMQFYVKHRYDMHLRKHNNHGHKVCRLLQV